MHKFGKYVLTNVALGLLIATVTIALVSLFLGISVYWDVRFYLSFHQALAAYSSEKMEVAIPAIDKAVAYRGDYAPARVLKAKMLIDSVTIDTKSLDMLNGAESLLREKTGALKSGPAAAAVKLMIAASHLKRFDLARAQKQPGEAELKEAQAALEEAELADPENPDLAILRAHLEFRRANYDAAEKRLAEAGKLIDEARTEERIPTIDTMVDYYVGLMVVAYRKDDYSAARMNANRVLMLRPDWGVPMANQACFEARRLATTSVPREEFETRASDYQNLITSLQNTAQNDPTRARWALDAAYSLSLAMATYHARTGQIEAASSVFLQTFNIDPKRGEALWAWVHEIFEARKREGITAVEKERLLSYVRSAVYPRFAQMDLPPEEQAVAYNNLGIEHLLVHGNTAEAENMFRLAEKKLQYDKSCAPQVYCNLAVLYDRMGRAADVPPLLKQLREAGPGERETEIGKALAVKYAIPW